MCLPCGMRCSSSWAVSSFFTMRRRLPRMEPSKFTTPSMRAISAASFGRRASNSSATRGRPPGDVLGLGGLPRCLGKQRSGRDDVALVDHELGAHRDRVSGDGLAGVVAHLDLRIEILLVLDNHRRDAPGRLVKFPLHGDPGDRVLEGERAALLGKHRHVVGIPQREHLALVDLLAVGRVDDRTNDDIVGFRAPCPPRRRSGWSRSC